jgi:hypothetical protein
MMQATTLQYEQSKSIRACQQFMWFMSHDLLVTDLLVAELHEPNKQIARSSLISSPSHFENKKRAGKYNEQHSKWRGEGGLAGSVGRLNELPIGFMVPKKLRNLALLLLTVPVMCLVRYIIIVNKSDPVTFLVHSSTDSLRLYNYMIMGNWALVTTVLYNDTMPMRFQQSSQEFKRVKAKYDNLLDGITAQLADMATSSTEGKLYSQLYNTNVCYILAKRSFNNRIPPFCGLALNQMANNSLVRFLHRYGSLWDQLITSWNSLPPENRMSDMLKNSDFVGLVASFVVDYHGIPNCIYYHLLVPNMLLMSQETQSLIQTLNLTNILSVAFGLVVFGLIWISCKEIFWDERNRLANLIKSIPLSLILSSSSLQNSLRNAINKESGFSW